MIYTNYTQYIEYCQEIKYDNIKLVIKMISYKPFYETLYKKGPDHAPEFCVAVTLNGQRIAQAVGQSKQKAGAKAALLALERINKGGK